MLIANKIASDDTLNSRFMVQIPSDLCEVKGVCPIPLDFSEEEIFNSAPKNLAQFGKVSETCTITEVKRFQRKQEKSTNVTYLNLVSICFSGNVLPSHVCLDGINFPIKPYREPVIQCRNCWHFNHNDRVCTRKTAICSNCGLAHDLHGQCTNPTVCINCKGPHKSSSSECPIYRRFLNEKVEKANRMKPRMVPFIQPLVTFSDSLKLNEQNFPHLGTQPKKNKKNHGTYAAHAKTFPLCGINH